MTNGRIIRKSPIIVDKSNALDRKVEVEYVLMECITPPSRAIRRYTEKLLHKLGKNIQKFGFINPIIIDKTNCTVAGYARYIVARRLGLKRIPCIRIEDLTAEELRLYALADNRLAQETEYIPELLRIELQELFDLKVNLDLSGFDAAEIDSWMHVSSNLESDADENIPDMPQSPVTRLSDEFTLGDHRIICGDARDPAIVKPLVQNTQCSIVITDPPYNLKTREIRGHSDHDFDDFLMAAGEMTAEEFIRFLICLIKNFIAVSEEGALHYYFMDWRHLYELLTAARPLFGQFINLCVWCKNNGGMGSFYRSQHELIAIFKHGTTPHINNIELGKHGRNRSNVWNYAGLSAFGADRNTELGLHPTVKPIPLLKDILLDASRIHDIVLDGCLGSGSTLIAAERTQRRCFGIELDPRYVDVTIQRWQQETGEPAIHIDTGLTFDELAKQRLQPAEVSHG